MEKTIYLAGGFKSGWQQLVKNKLINWEIFDPSNTSLLKPEEYTKWDLNAIQKSNIVLAYLEENNPGGYALSLEIGYAKALEKTILLIEEHPNESRKKYFDMVREVSNYTFDSLHEAIKFLKEVKNATTI